MDRYQRIDNLMDFKSIVGMMDVSGSYPVFINILSKEEYSKLEKEQGTVSYKMLQFYYTAIVGQIVEWNREVEEFLDKDTGLPIIDKYIMDSFLRSAMYCIKIKTSKGTTRTPKTLKMDKANRKEVLAYFELIILVMARKGLEIHTRDLNDIRSMIEQENK